MRCYDQRRQVLRRPRESTLLSRLTVQHAGLEHQIKEAARPHPDAELLRSLKRAKLLIPTGSPRLRVELPAVRAGAIAWRTWPTWMLRGTPGEGITRDMERLPPSLDRLTFFEGPRSRVPRPRRVWRPSGNQFHEHLAG
jgi:hypothetical protein